MLRLRTLYSLQYSLRLTPRPGPLGPPGHWVPQGLSPDFFKYYTRQNILAPTLGAKLIGGKSSVLRGGFFEGSERNVASPAMDGTGNPKVEQYRPKFTFSIMQGPDDGGKQQR